MKRTISFVLLCIFAFSLSGCYFDPEISLFPKYVPIEAAPSPAVTEMPSTTPTLPPMPTPTLLPPPAPAEGKRISQRTIVSFDTYTQHFYDPADGTRVILSFSCETPKVQIETNPEAAERINSFFEELNHSYFSAGDFGVSTDLDLETYLLSLAEDIYTAAANSGSAASQVLYSRKARVLRADDAVLGFEYSEYTVADTDSREKKSFFFDAHTGTLLTEEELTWPEFSEKDKKESGDLFVSLLTGAENDAEIIDLVTMNEAGSDILLSAEGPVYDVLIKTVGFAGSFYENEPLWYCNCLEDCALQLRAVLPEEVPDVMISFSDESGTVTQLVLSKDSSGTPVLASPKDFS